MNVPLPTGGAAQMTATILIVEDEEALTLLLRYNLEAEGFRVESVARGDEAETRLKEWVPDLLLLDWMLPGLSGIELCRRLRSRPETQRLPIIMLTARGEESERVRGLATGADDYVVKPFALRELLARVRAAVRRRAIPAVRPPTVLYRGSIEVEPDRRVARANSIDLHLRPKEFGLLATLAMEPGRVFSRQELLVKVWGEEIVVDERTVDVHVSWLRGKLVNAGVSGDVIKTIYGAGYRFISPAERDTPHESGDQQLDRVAL